MTRILLILIAITAPFIQGSSIVDDIIKNYQSTIDKHFVDPLTLAVLFSKTFTKLQHNLGLLHEFLTKIGILSHCIIVPKVCPNDNVTFWLYTRKTQHSPRKLDPTKPQTFSAAFDKNPVKIIIHGFDGDRDNSTIAEIRPALFQHGEYNVIAVEYGPIVRMPCYLSAFENINVVANCTVQLIESLVQNGAIQFDNIHVIGYSLGAQVAGLLANFFKNRILRRITGLDPAYPNFSFSGLHRQLTARSAHFVDVLHTNGWWLGQPLRTGHVDFYANGGTLQPGCNFTKENFTFIQWARSRMDAYICSHARAPIYYAESINSKVGFLGSYCNNYLACADDPRRANGEEQKFGEFVNLNSTSGNYFFNTTSQPPFALGK